VSRRPRIEVVDEEIGASVLDHAARVAYPFMSRETAEEAVASCTPAQLAQLASDAALYAKLTNLTKES